MNKNRGSVSRSAGRGCAKETAGMRRAGQGRIQGVFKVQKLGRGRVRIGASPLSV